MLNPLPTSTEQAILTLWHLTNMSLSAYAKLITQFHTPEQVLAQPLSAWQYLNLHASHIERFGEFVKNNRQSAFLQTTLAQIAKGEYGIIVYDDPRYPNTLKQLFDPPPLLFYKGDPQSLTMPQIAIVGTRKPTPHATKVTFDIAQYLAYEGIWIASGMAVGIDKQAHLGALAQTDPTKQGRTVAVLGTGIRQCYPKQHEPVLQQIIVSGGCVITELLPDNPPNKQGFPRRNRLVAGLSLATLVMEAALQSGSLITANLTNEQGKQVFAIPSIIDNEQAWGCHHLIREGATLIDHPRQILEDLGMLKSPIIAKVEKAEKSNAKMQEKTEETAQQSPMPEFINDLGSIPEHLFPLYHQLDWVGQDVDNLVTKTGLDIATLMGQMVELELIGKAMQQGGLYLRCRS